MTTVIREFKNKLGSTKLVKYEDENVYAVKTEAKPAMYSSLQMYNSRQEAMRTYQFKVYWLTENE